MSERDLTGFRRVLTYRGDTLQKIAARELGQASEWYKLIYINQLKYPFITDDPLEAGPSILLTGETIVLPASGQTVAGHHSEDLYGDDVALSNGSLTATDGDLSLAGGRQNLRQALANRLLTVRGELRFHNDYGCSVQALIGKKGSVNRLAVASFIKRALLQDYRVQEVPEAKAQLTGDALHLSATVLTVDGSQISVKTNG